MEKCVNKDDSSRKAKTPTLEICLESLEVALGEICKRCDKQRLWLAVDQTIPDRLLDSIKEQAIAGFCTDNIRSAVVLYRKGFCGPFFVRNIGELSFLQDDLEILLDAGCELRVVDSADGCLAGLALSQRRGFQIFTEGGFDVGGSHRPKPDKRAASTGYFADFADVGGSGNDWCDWNTLGHAGLGLAIACRNCEEISTCLENNVTDILIPFSVIEEAGEQWCGNKVVVRVHTTVRRINARRVVFDCGLAGPLEVEGVQKRNPVNLLIGDTCKLKTALSSWVKLGIRECALLGPNKEVRSRFPMLSSEGGHTNRFRIAAAQVEAVLWGGYSPCDHHNSRQVPIYPTVGYTLQDTDHAAALLALEQEGYTYSRIHNPTVDVLERRMALLEGGGKAVAVASGAAAVTNALLTLAKTGDNVVLAGSFYGGTIDLVRHTLGRLGIQVRIGDQAERSVVQGLIDTNTRALFVESLGNPRLDIPDFTEIRALADTARIPIIVDNTLVTPVVARVRDMHGDIAVYSMSKFMGGHAAAILGVVVDLGTFDWDESNNELFTTVDPSYRLIFAKRFGKLAYAARLRACMLRNMGATAGPFESWIVLQGLETLPLRMARHNQNALAVARFLNSHRGVVRVVHPSLVRHPHYRRCCSLMEGNGGGLVFFEVASLEVAKLVVNRFIAGAHVTQFGDARTTIQHPATTSHQQVSSGELVRVGLSSSMLRLSVGLEATETILAALNNALGIAV